MEFFPSQEQLYACSQLKMQTFRLRAILYERAIDCLSFEFYLNNRGIVSPPKGTYYKNPT